MAAVKADSNEDKKKVNGVLFFRTWNGKASKKTDMNQLSVTVAKSMSHFSKWLPKSGSFWD